MDEQSILAFLQCLLAEHYGQSISSLYSLNTRTLDNERIVYKMYRVDLPDYSSWVICAAHDDLAASYTFRWEFQGTVTAWLEGRASMLLALTQQEYPVPHVILSQSGACVVKAGAWSVLVTTWITGLNSQFQPEALVKAGKLLARLHTLPLEAMPSQPARWNSSYSIPHAISSLEEIQDSVPSAHYGFYQECHTTLHMILQTLPTLPETLIHGDCWMQNAIMANARIIFIDWESAGSGVALLDLADFLLRSQCDMYGAPPHALNKQNITAAVSGYTSHRIPDDGELDLLALATRFSSVWRAAWLVTQIRARGWTPRLEQGLSRLQASYDIAEPTAVTARSAFYRFR